MLKRQESLMKSSPKSRRENVTRQSNIGCMAGIFQFISKYHSRRRFLTSGKKQETNKHKNKSSTTKSYTNQENKNNPIDKTPKTESETRLISSRVSLRSPALPPEMRKSISSESIKSPLPLAEDVAEEVERRKIVSALEKCDEDLKAISSVINALRSNDKDLSSSHDPVISVLRLLDPSRRASIDRSSIDANGHVMRNDPSRNLGIDRSSRDANGCVMKTGGVMQLKKPQPNKDFFEKGISRVLNAPIVKIPTWNSKGKMESVDEVCRNLVWGIDRELGKIGLALEDHIFRYLIDEFVKEIGCEFASVSLPNSYLTIRKQCNAGASCTDMAIVVPPLPHEACRRRLSF